jgi:hypothetical protein
MDDNEEKQQLREEGIKRYPNEALCDWCGTIHTGDSYNCPTSKQEIPSDRSEPTRGAVTSVDEIVAYCKERITEITKHLKENTLLPKADSAPTTSGKSTRSRGQGLNWLRNEDLSKTPKAAKILAVRYDGENKFGPRVILKMAFEGETKFWGVSIKKNPNYKLLLEKFGEDENDWVSSSILLWLEAEEFSEQYYTRVGFPEAKEKSRK